MKSAAEPVFQKVITLLGKLKKRIKTPNRIESYSLLTIVAGIVYGVAFSFFTVLRHDSFFSAAWDLGNFNQAFYTTLRNGSFFYYTADVFFSPSGSIFAIHTSPILFLLVPFYAISPSPETLLVLKAFGIGLAAIPLHFLSQHLLGSSKAGFAMALIYLLYAPLQGANWFDFQQSAFIPLFVFLTYYLMIKKKWKLYFPAMILSLMIEEHVAIIVGILAILHLSYRFSRKTFPKSIRKLKTSVTTVAVATIAICVAYLFIAMFIKNSFPVSADFAHLYKASGNFRILGSSDTLSLPIYVLMHPDQTFQALIYDFPFKFFYLTFLFAPLLFIPLRNRFVLGILFILSPFLLSNYHPYYMLGIHYPFYVIPLIFIGAIYGLLRLDRGAKIFNLRTMMAVTLLFAVSISPLSPVSKVFTTQNYVHYSSIEFSLDQNKKSLNDLISLVPSDASVLTQNVVFPHVSNRINAYVIPFSDYEQPLEMGEYVDNLISNSDYVLLDMNSLSPIDQIVLDKIMKDNYYGAYALGSQSVLFKKAYSDEPINTHYVDNRTFAASHDFIVRVPPSSILDDPTSHSGEVVFYPKDASGFCISGPYIYLLPGKYEATFTIKAGSHGLEWLGTIDVATNVAVNIPSFRDFYGFELKTNEWTNFTIPFGLPTLKNQMEFRVYSRGLAEILVDRVFLRRVSAKPTSDFSLKTLRLPNIKVSSGNITEEGFLIHSRGAIDQVFWYGPYWSYSPGNYRTTFRLKTEPRPQALDMPVLTLSVSGRANQLESPTVLIDRVLYTQDFAGNNASGWSSFTLDFTIEKPLIEVEFRGLWPSPDYDIYLAFIILEILD